MAMSLQRQVSLSLQRQVSTSGNLNDALEEDDARNEDRRRDDRRREAARARFRRGVRKAVLMSRFIQNTKTLFRSPCSQIDAPPHSLHWLR